MLSHPGSSMTLSSSKSPWKIVESFVSTPEAILTELRMMTEVTGRPPRKPQVMLPTPWAISSRLAGECRCLGSRLSTASRFSSVSSEATIAMVTAAT